MVTTLDDQSVESTRQVYVVVTNTVYPYDATHQARVAIYGVYDSMEKAVAAQADSLANSYADVTAEIETYDVE